MLQCLERDPVSFTGRGGGVANIVFRICATGARVALSMYRKGHNTWFKFHFFGKQHHEKNEWT